MIELGLRNVRSFEDSGRIELRPITLLLGRNSSGKSTVARFLPVLRQSMEVSSRSPVVWTGDLVDFGDFLTVLRRGAPAREIGISLGGDRRHLPIVRPLLRNGAFWRMQDQLVDAPVALDLVLKGDESGLASISQFQVRVGDDRVDVAVSDSKITSIAINGRSLKNLIPSDGHIVSAASFVPQIVLTQDRRDTRAFWPDGRETAWEAGARREMRRLLRTAAPRTVRDPQVAHVASRLEHRATSEEFQKHLRSFGEQQAWQKAVARLGSTWKEHLEELRVLSLLTAFPELLIQIAEGFAAFLRGVAYIGPARASGARYTRKRDLRVSSISPTGENLAEFLSSLDRDSAAKLNTWLTELFGQRVQTTPSSGHLATEIARRGDESWFNIADVGFGFSQMLPVAVQLWLFATASEGPQSEWGHPTALVVEQPELHLHPALQSRIADALVKASTDMTGNRIMLVETHSQHVINRIGSLVHQKRISPDEIALYVFEQSQTGTSTVRRATFGLDGELVNWPFGFFSSEDNDF